jgi:hypothetical protein
VASSPHAPDNAHGCRVAPAGRSPRLRGRRQPIAFTLPPELVERIDAIASEERRSRTMMIEIAIREWLETRRQT